MTVEQLAEAVELSSSHLQHLVKRDLGSSMIRYRRERALDQAALLLRTTGLTIRIIRKRIGITDASHFTKYFKEYFGITPRQYRQRYSVLAERLELTTDASKPRDGQQDLPKKQNLPTKNARNPKNQR